MHLIRTISGKETAVEADLGALGIASTLPMCTKRRRLNKARRWVAIEQPVFPCYIFAAIPEGMHPDVKAIKGVIGSSIVELNRFDVVQVDRIASLAVAGYFNDKDLPTQLEPGQVLSIIGGLFEGQSIAFDSLDGEKLRGEIQGRKVALDSWHVSLGHKA